MSQNMWILFILASLPIHGAPGPNNVLAIRNGMALGPGRAGLAMLARLPGYALIFLAAGLGIAAVLAAAPRLFALLTVAGGLYIAWLGWKTLRMREARMASDGRAGGLRKAAMSEFATALANPKAILFATAFYAQFIDPSAGDYASRYMRMVATSLILEGALGFAYCLVGGLAAATFGSGRALLWLARASGAVLLVLGLGLAVETAASF